MEPYILRSIGLFLGLLIRLFAPAIYVWYNTPEFQWDHKYTKQFILGCIIALIAVFMGYTDPEPNLTGEQIFYSSIKDGVLLEEVINQFRKWDDIRISKMLDERDSDDSG